LSTRRSSKQPGKPYSLDEIVAAITQTTDRRHPARCGGSSLAAGDEPRQNERNRYEQARKQPGRRSQTRRAMSIIVVADAADGADGVTGLILTYGRYPDCPRSQPPLAAEDNLNPERAQKGLCPAQPIGECAGIFGQPDRFATIGLPAAILVRLVRVMLTDSASKSHHTPNAGLTFVGMQSRFARLGYSAPHLSFLVVRLARFCQLASFWQFCSRYEN